MSQIKLVVFDANGVCINGGFPETSQALGKKFKRDWKEIYAVLYTKYFNMAAVKKISQQSAWADAIKELNLPITVKEIKKIHYGLMSVNKATINLVNSLKKKYQVALLSKNTRSHFNDLNKLFPKMSSAFGKNMINTWEYNLPKASPETMKFILKRFKASPAEAVYIDDQEQNLQAAKDLGVHTILFKNFSQGNKKLKTILK